MCSAFAVGVVHTPRAMGHGAAEVRALPVSPSAAQFLRHAPKKTNRETVV